MVNLSLCGEWQMTKDDNVTSGVVPGSVYSFLLNSGKMEDPYYRDKELDALALLNYDYTFTRHFDISDDILSCRHIFLHCDGLDTMCNIVVNHQLVGVADNMHRVWEFDIGHVVQHGSNHIDIHFSSPTKYIKQAYQNDFIGGTYHAMAGFPHLRKAHCMFGWDWGPRLPDAGIWRDIYIVGVEQSRIVDLHIRQSHKEGQVWLTASLMQSGNLATKILLHTPDGGVYEMPKGHPYKVEKPQLWWPNGYGLHPLYTVTAQLLEDNVVVESRDLRVGLRTMTVIREKDEWGESFAQCVNGVRYFAMGADYIPEDNLLSRVAPRRTRELLQQCVAANFNSIRVWGGGYYPDDFFFDVCDELGLVVWQDFMFACANYSLTEDFEKNIRQEFIDNVKRLRHHPSLGLWCGNNEMEMFQLEGEYSGNCKTRSDYIRMFEHIIPEVLREYDPDTYYWPASPSSGGGFDAPNDPNRGDVHYWDVWHGGKPFSEYRKFYFRYASEFGFQSFPCMKTIESFTLPQDRNIFSRVMEMHQRNEGANGKIMNYLAQTFLYPNNLDTLIYASQLLQAEAIKYGVEHWRRHRGRCMGAIYWQLNDIWPVASWASIDYFGRWKALHYYAKRFFAPLTISCHEVGETTNRLAVISEPSDIETSAHLCVCNETLQPREVTVCWQLREATSKVLEESEIALVVPRLTSVWADKIMFENIDYLGCYFSYQLVENHKTVARGTSLFTAPKHFAWQNPLLSYELLNDTITITAKAYAKCIEIYSPDSDLVFEDNFFDMDAGEYLVKILSGNPKTLHLRSIYDIG